MDDSCGLWRSRSLWKNHNPRYLLQLMFLPSYSGWFTGERDSINTCILMSMFHRVSEIHVFSENQTMKIILKKNLLIYCHAKMKMKWQNKYVYSWIITRYTTVTLLLGALYMYTGVFPFLFIYFLHLRLFKHYLSLEMYYIKVMINFTKNNHFFFYFAYHYLPLFFSPDKKPILLSKTIHA